MSARQQVLSVKNRRRSVPTFIGSMASGMSASFTPDTSPTYYFSFSGGSGGALLEGDTLICICATSGGGSDYQCTVSSLGWYAGMLASDNITLSVSVSINYMLYTKTMGATPDTSIIFSLPNTAYGNAFVLLAFRGLGPGLLDVPIALSTSSSGTTVLPPPIFPVTKGCPIIVGGLFPKTAAGVGTYSSSEASGVCYGAENIDASPCLLVAGVHEGYAAGLYTPPQFSGGATGNSGEGRCFSIALRPALA